MAVSSDSLEIDESLLTGESDPIMKEVGDEVLSGSFVASGTGIYKARRVGADSYAARLAEEARQFTMVRSDLRRGIDSILKAIAWVMVPTVVLLLWSQLAADDPAITNWKEALRGSIAGLVALPSLGIYTATKYAVVGISETLRAELAPFGIGVSVLCPAFVKTRLADSERNRPAELGAPGDPNAFIVEALKGGMDTGEVADAVVAAIESDELYIFTHADSRIGFQMRADAILQAFPEE